MVRRTSALEVGRCLDDVSPDAIDPGVALDTEACGDGVVEKARLSDSYRLVGPPIRDTEPLGVTRTPPAGAGIAGRGAPRGGLGLRSRALEWKGTLRCISF